MIAKLEIRAASMGSLMGRGDPVLDGKERKTPLTDRKVRRIAHGSILSLEKVCFHSFHG